MSAFLALAACGGAKPDAADAGPPPAVCTGPDAPGGAWRDDGPPFFLVLSRFLPASSNAGHGLIPDLVVGAVSTPGGYAIPSSDGAACEDLVPSLFSRAGIGPSAGAVTLASTEVLLTAVPSDAGQGSSSYSDATGANASVEAGASISVSATGDQVPAFELTALAPTPPVAFMLDVPSDGGAAPRFPDGGVAVFWRGASCGDLLVVEIAVQGVDTANVVRCLAPARAGVFAIPPDLLTQDSLGTSVFVYALRQVSADAGDWPVLWEASVPALSSDGGLFHASVR